MSRSTFFQGILQETNKHKYTQPKKSKPKDQSKQAIKIQRCWRYYCRRKIIGRVRMLEQFLDKGDFKMELSNQTFNSLILERVLVDLQIACTQIQLLKQQSQELRQLARKQQKILESQQSVAPIQEQLTVAVTEIKQQIMQSNEKLMITYVADCNTRDKMVGCVDNLIRIVEQI